MTRIPIDATETLNDLVARMPEALPVLQQFGLDTCCGGSLPLEVAAQHHNLDVGDILAALVAATAMHTHPNPPSA
ncbi:MAG: DUF542 domain-containing protein [Oscillochloris sp.]|nr:DUF542 domain-containing protein [Oscillochloris sp.]